MEYKTLQLNIASAKDLKNVNIFIKMQVYAVVSISGDPHNIQKTKTPLDKQGNTNPTWNFPVTFTFNEILARQNRLTLEINIRCFRNLAADKDVGSVQVPLGELLKHTVDGELFQHVSYQVRKPSGKPEGVFNFSYKFNVPMNVKSELVTTGYPAPEVGSSFTHYPVVYAPPQPHYKTIYRYPPSYCYDDGYQYQQAQTCCGYPQQSGYGYPQQSGYGHLPQQALVDRKSQLVIL